MWVIYPLIFIAGFVDSIAGGGGLISLTSYYAVGLPPHMAAGTNKLSSSAGTLVASIRFILSKNVNWTSALLASGGALAGSAVGARLALGLPERYLQMILLVLTPLLAVFTIAKKDFGTRTKDLPENKIRLYSLFAGLLIGAYDGFFGPGTGAFLTIIFSSGLGFEMAKACGNTRIVNLSSNLAALVTFIASGDVNYAVGIPCALCSILGGYLGSGLAIRKGAAVVRPVLAGVVALLLVKVFFDLISA